MKVKFPLFVSRQFQRLQWRLAISYLLTSVIVLCLLELLVTLIGITTTVSGDRGKLEQQTRLLARSARPAFPSQGDVRQQWQALWELHQANDPAFEGYLVAIDGQGRVLMAVGNQAPAPGSHLQAVLPASVQQEIQQSVSSHTPPYSPRQTLLHTSFEQGNAYAVAPLRVGATQEEVLIVRGYYVRFSWENMLAFLLFFGGSAAVFLLGAGTVGLAFGVVTARGLVHRLQSIATAVDDWSQGDFSRFVRDPSQDELGQLAYRLNQMAHQLQQLLTTRQDLATLEERNRLARDLHDSIKQQVFAVSLQISTARALLDRQEPAAQTHLLKAEDLIRQTQRELTTLISALRPVELEGRSLVEALQSYVRAFQEQTGILVELEVDGKAAADLAMENALFRIVQEGLANVARHSHARAARVHLIYSDVMTLSLSDNGQGFDVAKKDQQGFGLSSMRSRIEALGGQFTIQSERGKGTTITVSYQHTRKDAV